MKKKTYNAKTMLTLSNGLSFIRAPLALLFLQSNLWIRIVAIFLAMLSDCVDGYLARRYRSVSRFGTIFDPAMDKFFVYFVLLILFIEKNMEPWQIFSMLTRDGSLCIFGIYLLISKQWKNFHCQSIRWGKITTAMQFLVLVGITLNFRFSSAIYFLFITFGALAFKELWDGLGKKKKTSH